MNTQRIAVVLLNLGAPDQLSSVKPFLFNLFNDPAIINLPNPFRFLLAKLISSRREPEAKHIYSQIGGGSPLLENTQAQAAALERMLGEDYKVFVAMRYWHPRAYETVRQVGEYGPDEVVLLPLYPQFSTTTTSSSFLEWEREAFCQGLKIPTRKICCYPTEPHWIEAVAELIVNAASSLEDRYNGRKVRILFSAHGLPKRVIQKGDPYQWQVEKTVAEVLRNLDAYKDQLSMIFDSQISYQSRVGPLEWIGPATEDEIIRAGQENLPLLVVPIAFVSDHSETLVELDITYRALAMKSGVPEYIRIPTVGSHPTFIQGLKELVINKVKHEKICPSQLCRCYCIK